MGQPVDRSLPPVDRSLPFPFPTAAKSRKRYPPYHPPRPVCVYKFLKYLCVMSFHWKGGKLVPPSQAPRSNGDDVVAHRIVLGDDYFTVDNQPPRKLYDPANKQFLESLMNDQCPRELEPKDMDEIHFFEFGKEEYLTEPLLPSLAE